MNRGEQTDGTGSTQPENKRITDHSVPGEVIHDLDRRPDHGGVNRGHRFEIVADCRSDQTEAAVSRNLFSVADVYEDLIIKSSDENKRLKFRTSLS
ncbi:hypothetical protein RRG08_061357 [Elysia crispata]|uniref:Uncharacterized protein n=1 Tax=Elysia crispata TaxID=231223 RepID=A0AAE1AGT0_9GAST|nr:hypothetical protein RRG08_061357 [Elysia crispata]